MVAQLIWVTSTEHWTIKSWISDWRCCCHVSKIRFEFRISFLLWGNCAELKTIWYIMTFFSEFCQNSVPHSWAEKNPPPSSVWTKHAIFTAYRLLLLVLLSDPSLKETPLFASLLSPLFKIHCWPFLSVDAALQRQLRIQAHNNTGLFVFFTVTLLLHKKGV